jgi:hypothetical protein
MSRSDYYERQTSKDCSVHSLNNALGWSVVKPEEVSKEIERRVAAFAQVLGEPMDSKKVKTYWNGLANDGTFFCAECVWYAAASMGRSTVPKKIEDYDGKTLTDSITNKEHLIFLGKRRDGAYHAVGARFGFIYDSLNDGPAVPLIQENINEIYSKVFAVFAF